MREQLTDGTQAAGRGFDELETKARKAYLTMQDSAEKVAAAERKYEAARERGAANTEALGRRVERARLAEIEAIERATNAYRDYERAAQQAGEEGSRSFVDGMRGAVGEAAALGQDFAGGLLDGFAGAGIAAKLAGFAVPGAGWLAAGVTAGALLAQGVSQGLETLQVKDLFQARLGIDDATMEQYGRAAGAAYADVWGASVQDNLRAVQFAVQGGVISPGASDEEIESTIRHMQTLASVMEVDVQEAARATGQLMRGGLASSGEEAADIIAAGFQNGLDISGDWLDTITEYTTQFRKLGIDGGEAIGLIRQGLEGGARDSDKVADSLKEFSIRAVDGSKLTAEGFAAIGLNADDMAQRFLRGGDSARQAFDATLQAIKSLDDPIQQAMTWQALFGTQWEDMGDAINSMDLSKARSEFGDTEGAIQGMSDKLSEHQDGWTGLSRKIDETFAGWKRWLADTDIARFLSQGFPDWLNTTFFDNGPKPGDPDWQQNYPDIAPRPIGPQIDPRIPGVVSGQPLDPALIAAAQEDLKRRGINVPGLTPPTPPPPPSGAPAPNFYKDWYGAGAGAPGAPVPGDRTPMQTETQKQAADAAGGAGAKESLPPAPVLPIQYTNTGGLPDQIASATTRLDEARHDSAQKEARLNQLKQLNIQDANVIQDAENDVATAKQKELDATRKLQEAQLKASEGHANQLNKTSADLTSFFAQIDQDFGVSEGLPGIAENITKFLMNLAIAPAMAQLGMGQMAAGFKPGEAGSGLFGMMANQGAFGSQFVAVPGGAGGSGAAGGAGGSSGGYGYGAGTGGYGAVIPSIGGGTPYTGVPLGTNGDVTNQPGLDLLRSMGLKGTTYGSHTNDGAPTDREIDVTDPTGGNGLARLAEFARQNPSLFEEFIYMDPAGNKTGIRGGQLVGPGTSQPGYYANNWAGHQDHAHIEPTKGGGLGFGDIEDGMFGPGATPWSADWNAIAQGESGGNWQVNTGNGYSGGLQFLPSSWQAAGGTQYAPSAHQASPYQQAVTAERLLAQQGPGAWPNTFVPGSAGPAAPSQSATGGRAWNQGLPASAGAAWSGGGLIGSALSGAMGAAGGAAGGFGGGAAAAGGQMAMQLLGRAAGAVGQYAGNAVGGVLETFMLNGSALGDPSTSWVGRILGGIAGVRPQLPNSAGEMGGKDNPNMAEAGKKPAGPLTPEQVAAQQKAMGAAGKAGKGDGNTINNNINVTNNRAREDGTGQAIQAHLNAGQAAVQPR
ncbi:transglycosylase family protein [Mycolicibacterium gilvum]|uniref:transglycosylase family protein n=1 Tax=Mycolicibacterium gilvum TaxID=1804 RepID=UPI0040452806